MGEPSRHEHEQGAPLTTECDNWCRGKYKRWQELTGSPREETPTTGDQGGSQPRWAPSGPAPPRADLMERLEDFKAWAQGPHGSRYSAELLSETIKYIEAMRDNKALILIARGTPQEWMQWARDHNVPESMRRKYQEYQPNWKQTAEARGALVYILQDIARSVI